MKAYQLILAVVVVCGVAAFYALLTARIDLATYMVLVMGVGVVGLLFALQEERREQDGKYLTRTTTREIDASEVPECIIIDMLAQAERHATRDDVVLPPAPAHERPTVL